MKKLVVVVYVIIALVLVGLFSTAAISQQAETPPTLEQLQNIQQMDYLKWQNAQLTVQILERNIKDRQVLIESMQKKAEETKTEETKKTPPAPKPTAPKK
jgi:predicted PurR-regulated permease PerM